MAVQQDIDGIDVMHMGSNLSTACIAPGTYIMLVLLLLLECRCPCFLKLSLNTCLCLL